MKRIGLAMVVVGLLLVLSACEKKRSTAQPQSAGAGGDAKAKELVLDLGNKVTLKLVEIPAGKFLMGSPKDEYMRSDDEGLPPGKWENGSPQIEVTISKPFYLGVYEVTMAQYAAFMKDTGTRPSTNPSTLPSTIQTGDYPVVDVSWNDAQAFCKWVSKKTGKTVVLPTEAQWEYACRAGSKTAFCFGDKYEELGNYAWYEDNSMDKNTGEKMTHPVGQKKPNAWGLYDMHGNAMEWCLDYYTQGYAGPAVDPAGPKNGRRRVMRGGSWFDGPWGCRSAGRDESIPDLRIDFYGFRVAIVSAGVDLP